MHTVARPHPTLPSFSINLCEGVDGRDTIDSRSHPGISGATLGWKMNTGHFNRCFMVVAGALFGSFALS